MAIEIEIDKASSFTLEMKIDGDVSSTEPPKMRFSILCDDFTFSLNATRIDNGVYEIKIPKLVGIFEPGEYEANVEVFIDGKHFVPLKETVNLRQELQPVVKVGTMPSSGERSAPKVTIEKIKKPVITKTDEIITKSK